MFFYEPTKTYELYGGCFDGKNVDDIEETIQSGFCLNYKRYAKIKFFRLKL